MLVLNVFSSSVSAHYCAFLCLLLSCYCHELIVPSYSDFPVVIVIVVIRPLPLLLHHFLCQTVTADARTSPKPALIPQCTCSRIGANRVGGVPSEVGGITLQCLIYSLRFSVLVLRVKPPSGCHLVSSCLHVLRLRDRNLYCRSSLLRFPPFVMDCSAILRVDRILSLSLSVSLSLCLFVSLSLSLSLYIYIYEEYILDPTGILFWDPCPLCLPEILTVAHVFACGLVAGNTLQFLTTALKYTLD